MNVVPWYQILHRKMYLFVLLSDCYLRLDCITLNVIDPTLGNDTVGISMYFFALTRIEHSSESRSNYSGSCYVRIHFLFT